MKKVFAIFFILLSLFLIFGCTTDKQFDYSGDLNRAFVRASLEDVRAGHVKEFNENLIDENEANLVSDLHMKDKLLFVVKLLKTGTMIGIEDVDFIENKLDALPNDNSFIKNKGILLTSGAQILAESIAIVNISKLIPDKNSYEGNSVEIVFIQRNDSNIQQIKKYADKEIVLDFNIFSQNQGNLTQEELEEYFNGVSEYAKFRQGKLKESIAKNDLSTILYNGYILYALDTAYGVKGPN